jgi:hypothetical protein
VSLERKGHTKTMGGDECYVTYTDASSKKATLISLITTSNRDGTDDLNFSTTPMNPVNIIGLGIHNVHLQHTLA